MAKIYTILMLMFILFSSGCTKNQYNPATGDGSGTITLSGAWALYPMTVKWGEEYAALHPGVRIDIGAGGAGKGMADVLSGTVDIGMVSRTIHPSEIEKGAWWVSVAKDAVVPTFNAHNPYSTKLKSKGVSRQQFIAIFITGETTGWGEIAGTEAHEKIHLFGRSDACGAAQTWAEYCGKNQEDLLGIGVYGDPGVAEAVRNDIYGLGFNNINFAYDANTKVPVADLDIIPIDLNADGHIDATEAFYENRDTIVRAIAEGVYPSPPSRNLHFVCRGKPEKKTVSDFIAWVLGEGRRFVSETGYIPLRDDELMIELEKLK
jgi:phosphate transport system substrate-binding protein